MEIFYPHVNYQDFSVNRFFYMEALRFQLKISNGHAAGPYIGVVAYAAWLVAYAVQPEKYKTVSSGIFEFFVYRITNIYRFCD